MAASGHADREPAGGAAAGGWPSPVRSWYAVAVLLIAYTVSFIDRSIVALLVQPIQADLGISDTEISLLYGFAFAIFYTTLGIPIARLADRMSRRRIIAVGIAFWSVMTAACGLAQKFWQLFLARVGVGVGEAALSPAAYSMIADMFPKKRLARALGIYSTGVYIGAGLAFMIGAAVIEAVAAAPVLTVPLLGEIRAWQLTFIVVGLPGVLIALLMLTVREPERRGAGATAASVPIRTVVGFVVGNRRTFLTHFLGFALLGIVFNAYLSWAPTFLVRRFGLSAADAGYALGLMLLVSGTLGIVCGGAVADWLQSRGRRDGTILAGIIAAVALTPLAAAATLLPGLAVTLAALAVFFFFASFPYGASAAALQIVTPNRMRAQVSALYLLVLNLLGIGLSATAVALVTDFVLKDPARVGVSMAVVGGIAAPLAAIVLACGLRAFVDSALAIERGTARAVS